MNKELLKLKKIYRKSFPTTNEEIGKILLSIFAVKYSLSESDFQRKLSTCVNLSTYFNDSQCVNECPLSDKQLVPILGESKGLVRVIYKLLLEISDETPSVTYAPLLFPMISFLCLYLTESEIKNIVCILLGDIDMIPSSTNDWNVYCHMLYVLGRKYASKAHRRLKQSHESDPHRMNFWPYVLWSLPLAFLNRIIVCYFIEGGKVFLRAGLLIWKIAYQQSLTSTSPFDWKDAMVAAASNISRYYTPQKFLNRMFAIRNFSRLHIMKYKRGLLGALEVGEWISPTTSKGYVAFKTKDTNPSTILNHSELIEIIRNLNPYLAQINKPVLLFLTNKNGFSLRTLYNIAGETSSTLLIIETSLGEVIGAFCADPWTMRNRTDLNRFYGKGECFVFKIRPLPIAFYRWNQDRENVLANMFQRATTECFEVGGGNFGAAIHVGVDLYHGSSCSSSTFDNPCLTDLSQKEFLIKSLELLAFEESH